MFQTSDFSGLSACPDRLAAGLPGCLSRIRACRGAHVALKQAFVVTLSPMNSLPAEQTDREKSALWDGVRACAPAMPGLLAWGAVTGMVLVQSGLSVWQALAMTLIVYAGSAQLATLPLIVAGAPMWVIVLTALLVNFRFVIFSAVVGPHFAHLHWIRRLWYGYFNADLVMAFFPQRFPRPAQGNPASKLGYFKGLAFTTWWAWEIGSVVGILLASQIPVHWGIGFAGTLVLLGMTIPLIVNQATVVGVVVAGVISVAAAGIPYKLGLVLAIVGGIAAAVAADRIASPPAARSSDDGKQAGNDDSDSREKTS